MKKDMEKMYKTGEAAKVTGVSNLRISQYLHKGQVIPSVESKGQGRAALLSILDMLKIVIIALLSDSGMSAKVAGRVAAGAVGGGKEKMVLEHCLQKGILLMIDVPYYLNKLQEEVKIYEERHGKHKLKSSTGRNEAG